MVIVLIHWRIKSTDEAEAAFLDYWKKSAISDPTSFGGEFLSAPCPANTLPFRVDDLTFGHGILDCRHFVNVGLWKNMESFHAQVGSKMKDHLPIESFEADRRTRTVLEVREEHLGKWRIPTQEERG